jgi:hypothetical protein
MVRRGDEVSQWDQKSKRLGQNAIQGKDHSVVTAGGLSRSFLVRNLSGFRTAVEERLLNSVPTIIQPVLPLTSTSSLNPDSSRFEFTTIRNTNEKEIAYHYWVYEGLGNPTALFFYGH